jgi:hypothetical protein
VTFTDPYAETGPGKTRPRGLAEHLPYVDPTTGRVHIDRLPVTREEVRACGDALQAIYTARVEANA